MYIYIIGIIVDACWPQRSGQTALDQIDSDITAIYKACYKMRITEKTIGRG